jgi:sugar phosphate isomerase/epimerase
LKLAVADFSFPLLDHEQALDLIRMFDVEGVDLALMGNRSHIRPEQIRVDPDGWTERLQSRLRERGLEVADLFLIPWTDFERMAPNHPDAGERLESRQLFELISDLAVALGAGGMTLLPGIHWPQEPRETSFRRAVDELAWRVECARGKQLRISIEPHLGSIVDQPQAVLELVNAIPGLELTLDYTHFVFQGIAEAEIEPLVQHARHFHARGAAPGRMQTTLRANTIDYERVLDVMAVTGYDGYVGIEYVWTPADPPGSAYDQTNTDNVAETILMRDLIREHEAVR